MFKRPNTNLECLQESTQRQVNFPRRLKVAMIPWATNHQPECQLGGRLWAADFGQPTLGSHLGTAGYGQSALDSRLWTFVFGLAVSAS